MLLLLSFQKGDVLARIFLCVLVFFFFYQKEELHQYVLLGLELIFHPQ